MENFAQNPFFHMKTDGFYGELFRPVQDKYPGRILICFSGSDGKFELSRMLSAVFQAHGLTALALAYVMEEGLPNRFYHVPIDPLEAATKRMHDMGYQKVGLWGISKGAELALTAGSLLPELVNAVVAVAPMNTVCQGFAKEKGITILSGSSWSFHGTEVPYTSFGLEKFPLGQVLRKSFKARELTMYDLYIPLVRTPDPAAVIQVEKITGPILLISSKMDTMWPSEPAADQIMKRLEEKQFPHLYQHLSYDYGSHLFVPMELRLTKFFKGDRGRYKESGRRARMDSLMKTLEFVSQW
ncbi:MAG: acyl-CoA thioester hydrolase/BAAT C-terminal domain-containing protein [Eubacteriales bacterium]|nr:acyl-CoA thioester hydrolase/BAAT C-terminal domain-containing protein [Eubacteriales bacterium]